MPLFLLGVAVTALVALFVLVVIPGSTPGIEARFHANGLAVLEQVPVNDAQQWVLIRSENVANPVVLFVHGGPGTSQLTLMRKNTQPLEKYFTVVNWDQRRAAKSFAAGRDGARMNMGQFVDDIVDLSSYLANRLQSGSASDSMSCSPLTPVLARSTFVTCTPFRVSHRATPTPRGRRGA
jgi:hypothetical protein